MKASYLVGERYGKKWSNQEKIETEIIFAPLCSEKRALQHIKNLNLHPVAKFPFFTFFAPIF